MCVGTPERLRIDCVGFEAKAYCATAWRGSSANCAHFAHGIYPSAGAIGIPGLYVTEDPGSR